MGDERRSLSIVLTVAVTCFLLLVMGFERNLIPSLARSSAMAGGHEIRRGAIVSISVALDGEGKPWAVWEEGGPDEIDSEIYFAFWDGRGWSVPQLVTSASGGHAPVITFDGLGGGWLVWNEGGDLFYSCRDGDSWRPKREIDTSPSTRDRSPSLAVDSQGVLWLAWSGFDGTDEEIFFSRWGQGGWEKAQRVSRDDASPDLYDGSPHLAMGGDDRPWLVWVGDRGGLDDEIFYSRWEGDGWSEEGLVSTDDSSSDLMPTLAIDGRGRPWVAWRGEYDGKSGVLYSRWEGEGWSPESLVDMPSALLGGDEPALAIGPRGEPRLAWTAYDRQGSYIAYSRWEGGGWGRTQEITREGLPASPALMVDGEETPYILWVRSAPGEEALLAQRVEPPFRSLEGAITEGALGMAALVSDRYVAFGDSITWGGYAPTSYPAYEEGLLDANIAPSEVINSGRLGERTRRGKVRIIEVMNTYNPEFVLVMEGTNDVSSERPRNEIIDNLGDIIDRIKERGGKPVIATIPPRLDDSDKGYETWKVNQRIRNYLAPMKGIPVADVWQAIENYPNWWNYYLDKIHPSGPLMEVIAQAFYDAMVDWPYIYEDDDPPSSQVNDLSACQINVDFPVSWWGEDGDGTGIVSYDIQYKDGEGGWTGWLTDTTSTLATFTGGQRGHTYYFRSRAEDRRGNQEEWPTDYDAFTQVAHTVSGHVWGNRELPVVVAKVRGSPYGCFDVYTNHLGKYTLPLTMMGSVSVTVSQSNFGDLPPMYGVEAIESETTGVDLWLPPSDDVVTNGQFEVGLSDWSYLGGVQAVTDTVHTGLKAVELSGNSAISQTVTIAPTTMYSPTLSLMYVYTSGNPGDYFEVRVNDTRVGDRLVAAPDWAHTYLDLSTYLGQTVDLSFVLHQEEATPAYAYLDEISLGSAGQAPEVTFLPLITKED
jgi:lysophospholipase L1-like esterase